MKYTPLDPIPAKVAENDFNNFPDDPNISLLGRTKFWLRMIQKWSLVPFGLFIPLHGINTLVLPVIEPSYAPNDVLMMIREITPQHGSLFIWTSISLHVVSGLALRLINMVSPRTEKKRKEAITDIDSEQLNQRKIGLVGGLSGYFIGINKKLNYNPQVMSGWLLAPLVMFHGTLMKWIPNYAGVDIDFDYVKWLLSMDKDYIVRYGLGYIPLVSLMTFGTYHIVAGFVQFFRVRKLRARRRYLNLIVTLLSAGIFSVTRLGSQATIGMNKYYQPIMSILHISS